jgi:hypothetical protein
VSAAAPTPEPTGLSESQRRVLDDLAAHENAADPGYVLRMNAPVPDALPDGPGAAAVAATVARGRRRDLAVQVAVVGVILALVLPAAWTIALVLTVVLLVLPSYLVLKAMRDGGLEPPARR